MSGVRVSDAIYAAGVEAAGQLDRSAAPNGIGAARALAAALERRALPIEPLADGDGLMRVGDHDGVFVATAGDEPSLEMSGLLRHHHWQRVHLFTFGRQALSIRTISA